VTDSFDSPPREKRRPRFVRIPLRYILPNLVTLLGLCLGLTSIRFAFEGRFDWAVYAIIAAAVLDGLDGRIARALKGTSRFGAELDSLADFVDFGVAPAMLLYFWSLHDIKSAGWLAALVYAVACSLRLARFNVMIDEPHKPAWSAQFFTGMPSPAGAIVVMLPIYLHHSFIGLPQSRSFVPYEIAYVLVIAFLMVSRIPHFSGKQVGRIPREFLVLAMFGAVALILVLATFPMEVLLVFSILYLALIPLAVRRHAALSRGEPPVPPLAADSPKPDLPA
jgi:CDP-diacylglycerol--serine O-phosphatidyltransferase